MPKPERLFRIGKSKTGLGLFATQRIKRGQRIVEYSGNLIRDDDKVKPNRYLFAINDRWIIDGSPRSNIGRYANHSCRPNARTILVGRRIFIVGWLRIEPGDEITFNYGREYYRDLLDGVCACPKCSGKPKRSTR